MTMEWAESLLKKTALKGALVIAALAVAVPAVAGPLTFNVLGNDWTWTPTGGVSVNTSVGGTPNFNATTTGGGTATPVPFPGGIKVFGTGGASDLCGECGSQSGQLILNIFGDGGGQPDAIGSTSYPVHYDFSFGGSGFSGVWNLTYFINGQQAGANGTLTGSPSGDLSVNGLNPASPLTSWQIILGATVTLDPSGSFSLTIPDHTLQIGQVAGGVPEPAAWMLVLPGLALIALRRRATAKG